MSIAAVHTGLTPAVLEYKPSDPLVPERETQPDRATFADPEKRSLFSAATKVDKLTPWIGTELHGVQLSKLTDSQKDELALLVSEVGSVGHVLSTKLISHSVGWCSSVTRTFPWNSNTT